MFRKYYRQANDDIKPNRELINTIYEKAAEESAHVRKSAKIYRFATALAAVFVLVVGAVAYPTVMKMADILEVNKTLGRMGDNQKIASKGGTQTESGKPYGYKTADEAPMNDGAQPEKARIVPEPKKTNKNFQSHVSVPYDEFESVSDKEIAKVQEFLVARFGEEEDGRLNSFGIVGAAETDLGRFYLGRWSWFVIDHMSLVCDFVLADDFSQMYEIQMQGNMINWTTEYNLVD